MRKIVLIYLIFVFAGCVNDPVEKTVNKKSINTVEVKYPLPSNVDSLLILLDSPLDDTNKVNVLNLLSWKLRRKNPDTSIILSKQVLTITEKLISSPEEHLSKFGKKGMAKSYAHLGVCYRLKADYPKAFDYSLKALTIMEELKNKNGIVDNLGNLGVLFYTQGNYTKALDYYFKALKIDEELNDKKGIAADLGNIGIIYSEKADSALRKGDGAFAKSVMYPMALDYFFKAMKIDEELGNKNAIGKHLGNIGNIYNNQGNYTLALDYFSKALKIVEQRDDTYGIAINLSNIGLVYTSQEKYKSAFDYLYRSLIISDSIGARNLVQKRYELLSSLYEKSNASLPDTLGGKMLNKEQMRIRALYYFKAYLNLRDTLFSEDNKKQLVQKEMNYEFDKKQAAAKAEQDKKDALAKAELEQKEKERNYFIAGFGLVIVLAGFIFRGYRQKQKANTIISHQKELVEEKQKEILDSIHYAKRIQKSLLPSEQYLNRQLNRSSKTE